MTEMPLSEREEELVKLVATGASNKEISQNLNISVNTVKVHLRNIYSKLNVASRTEAAMWAVQNGLVETVGGSEGSDLHSTESGWRDRSTLFFNRVPSKLRLWFILIAAVLLVIIGFGVNQILSPVRTLEPGEIIVGPDFEETRWKRLADMPTARAGLAAVAYDNQIYAIAGEGIDGVVNVNERYDPASDTWETLNPKPIAVADVHAGVVGGRIFIPGGRLKDGTVTDVLEIFDPLSGNWDQGETIPVKLSGYALATFEGRIYIFGGWDGENYLDTVYIYDPTQDNWTEEMSLPQPMANAGVAEISGKIVVIGGISQAGKLDEVISLIPYQTRGSEGSWTTEDIFPSKCQRVTASSIVNTIYSIADDCLDETLQSKFIVFNQVGIWELIESPVQIDRTNSRLVSIDSYIYLLGGVINSEPIGNVIRYKAFYTVVVPIVR